MKKSILLTVLLLTLTLSACKLRTDRPTTPLEVTQTQPSATTTLTFATGRNNYTINVDQTPRQFIVYVPSGYDPSQPTPVVFMLHGSNQSGEVMYEKTRWVEKSEQENIIIVFPTSWKYKLTTSNRVEDKWNVARLDRIVEPGTELKDDVKFIRTILEQLEATFNVDAAHIYASGFSNGGAFVLTRLIPEMNDVFAAFSTCGTGFFQSTNPSDESFSEQNMPTLVASLYSIMGTNDEIAANALGATLPFPFLADEILQDPNLGSIFTITPQFLSLAPTYEVVEESGITKIMYNDSPTGAGNQFIFVMVNGMMHVYPNGENNRYGLNASDLFWDFFQLYHK